MFFLCNCKLSLRCRGGRQGWLLLALTHHAALIAGSRRSNPVCNAISLGGTLPCKLQPILFGRIVLRRLACRRRSCFVLADFP